MFSLIFFLGTLQLFALVLFNDEISNNTAEAVLNYNVFFLNARGFVTLPYRYICLHCHPELIEGHL
jgi:hypothetical protein